MQESKIYPLQIVSGLATGISYSSQNLIGSLLPSQALGQAGLHCFYNITSKNVTWIDTAGSFSHSSGVEELGYVFNGSSSKPIQARISAFLKAPQTSTQEGDAITFREGDGSDITFTKSGDRYFEADFGKGRSVLSYDQGSSCWILYNPMTNQRRVYNAQGQLVAKYRDGLDKTTYSYDSQGRIETITPPGKKETNRRYQFTYSQDSTGSEKHLISLIYTDNGKDVEMPLREYDISQNGLIQKITVYPQGTNEYTLLVRGNFNGEKRHYFYLVTRHERDERRELTHKDCFSCSGLMVRRKVSPGQRSLIADQQPYIVSLSYTQRADDSWGIASITQDDGSAIRCQYDQDSGALKQAVFGQANPRMMTIDDTKDKTDGLVSIEIKSGMKVDVTRDASSGLIQKVARYTGDQSAQTPDVTSYVYYNNRLTQKTAPDGSVTSWAINTDEQANNGLSYGTISSKKQGDEVISYKYDTFSGQLYTSELTSPQGGGISSKNYTFVDKIEDQTTYTSDSCVGIAFTVSSEGGVIHYERDQLTGLAEYERHFTNFFDASAYPEGMTLENLKSWIKAQFSMKAFSLKQTTYLPGTTLVEAEYEFANLTDDGYGLESDQYGVHTNQFDPLLRQSASSKTMSWSDSLVPDSQQETYTYSTFHLIGSSTQEKQFNEIDFWQNQEIATQFIPINLTGSYTYDDTQENSIIHAETQPNGRQDKISFNEHGQQTLVALTDTASDVTRTTQTNYDSAGRPAQTVKPTGQKSWTVYDNQNRLAYEVDALGVVTQYVYDEVNRYHQHIEFNNAIDLTDIQTVISGELIRSRLTADADNDRVTHHFFDQWGNETYTVDPKGYVTETRYNLHNKWVAKIRYTTKITPDQLSDLLQKTVPDFGGPDDDTVISPDTTDSKYGVTSRYFSQNGLEIARITPNGWYTETKYDGAKNSIVTRTPVAHYYGTRPRFSMPMVEPSSTDIYVLNYYDARNRLIAAVNGEGFLTSYGLDANSRCVKETIHESALDIATLVADDSHALPEPAASNEDRVITRLFNYAGKMIHASRTDQLAHCVVYDNMAQEIAKIQYDTEKMTAIDSGDAVRAKHWVRSVFGQILNETNAWIDSNLTSILSDKTLSPADRDAQVESFWSSKSIRYAYSDSGLLAKKFNTLNESTANNAGGDIYYYDARDLPVFLVRSEGQVSQMEYNSFKQVSTTRHYVTKLDIAKSAYQGLTGGSIDSDTLAVLVAYQSDNDPTNSTVFNQLGLASLKTDGEGYQTNITYNCLHKPVTTKHSMTELSSFDVLETNTYNVAGQLLGYSKASLDGSIVIKQSHTYDHPSGNWTTHTDTLGLITTHTLDKRGLVASETNNGSTPSTIAYTHDMLARVVKRVNQLSGETIQHVYVQASRTKTSTYPDGVSTRTQIKNVFGNVTSLKQGASSTVSWCHDAAGNVESHTNAIENTETTTRNTDGVVIKTVSLNGWVNQFVPNNAGQIVTKIEDLGGRNLTTTYKYDGLGRNVQTTNPRTVITTMEYNKNSCTILTTEDTGTDASPGLQKKTTRTFNGLGAVLTKEQSGRVDDVVYKEDFQIDAIGRNVGKIEDPDGLALTTTNTLNAQGKIVLTESARRDPAKSVQGDLTYTFKNEYGLNAYVITPEGECTEYAYDSQHREVVQYIYAGCLPQKDVLDSLTVGMSISDLSKLVLPYRGGTDTCKPYACEERSIYNSNGKVQYHVHVLRTDPDSPDSGQAFITEDGFDDALRVNKKTMHMLPWSWTKEPDWTFDTVSKAVDSIADSKKDRVIQFFTDDAGQAIYTVEASGQVVERCYEPDGKVWLTIRYANLVSDVSSIVGKTLEEMKTIVSALKDSDRDILKGSFRNSSKKITHSFESCGPAGSSVCVKRYVYDENNNCTQEVEFDAAYSLVSNDASTVLNDLQSLEINTKVDSVLTRTFDNVNKVSTVTDSEGYSDTYTRNSLSLPISQKDRNGNVWVNEFDAVKRRIKYTSPEVEITTTTKSTDSSGNITLTHDVTSRTVENTWGYDANGNTTLQTKDAAQSSNEETPKEATIVYADLSSQASFDSKGRPVSIWRDDVPIDDGSDPADVTLASMPEKMVTISQTTYRDGFGMDALITKNTLPVEAFIRDSAKRLRYHLKFNDNNAISVVEFKYNSVNERVWIHKYANPLSLSGDWDSDWFINTPIQFLSQLGTVSSSQEDKLEFIETNNSGLPSAVYSGLDATQTDTSSTDPDTSKFVGVVPYFDANSGGYGNHYCLVEREFSLGKCVRQSTLIDPSHDRYKTVLRWYSPKSGQPVAAEAKMVRLDKDSDPMYALTRHYHNTRGLDAGETNYATAMPDLSDKSLVELDEYLATKTSDKDRVTEKTYSLRKQLIKEINKNVTRYEVDETKDVPTFTEKTGDKVKNALSYNGTGAVLRDTKPYWLDTEVDSQPPVDACLYHTPNALGYKIASTNTPIGNTDNTSVPLSYSGYDGVGRNTLMQTFQAGADPSTLMLGEKPKPLSESVTTDPVALTWFNNRSLPQVKQMPKGTDGTEYVVTLTTHNEQKKSVREWGPVSQWKYDTDYSSSDSIDQIFKTYDRRKNLITKALYRDGVEKETSYSTYDVFCRNVDQGASEDTLVLKKIWDINDRLRITNALKIRNIQGIPHVRQYDLAGNLTQEIESASKDLMQLALLDLGTDDFHNRDDLEVTTSLRSESGDLLQQTMPTSTIGYSKEIIKIPVEMCTQIYADDYGTKTLAPTLKWPKASIDNAQLSFTLKDSSGNEYSLQIIDQDVYWEVDVSSYPTGNYTYNIDYDITDSAGEVVETRYQTTGSAVIVTSIASASGVVIPYVRDDRDLYFSGDVGSFTDVQLYDESGEKVGDTLSLSDGANGSKMVSVPSTFISGRYKPALINASGEQPALDALAINTLISPSSGTKYLTWEIPCEASLTISNDATGEPKIGTLAIRDTLPPDLQGQELDVYVNYTDVDDADQTQSATLTGSSDSFIFDNAVKSADVLTVTVAVDGDNQLILYLAEEPLESSRGIKDRDEYAQKALKRKVLDYGLKLKNSPKDGNCFFHAVLDQIKERCPSIFHACGLNIDVNTINHHTLRQLSVGALMLFSSDELAPYVTGPYRNSEEYISCMAKDKYWAESVVIRALARLLKVSLVLIDDKGDTSFIHGGSEQVLYLGYERGMHFQSARGEPTDQLNKQVTHWFDKATPNTVSFDINKAYHNGRALAGDLDDQRELQPVSQESSDLSYSFAKKRYAYMRGSDMNSTMTDIEYKDVSRDQNAVWVGMSSMPVSSGSENVIQFDVTHFSDGDYPFVKKGGDYANPPYKLGVLRGDVVVSSDSFSHPKDIPLSLRETVNPQRTCTRDVFGNMLTDTNTCGGTSATTTYEYNEQNKAISKTDPTVQIFNLDDPSTPKDFEGVTKYFHDLRDNLIGTQYPKGNKRSVRYDSGNNLLSIHLGDGSEVINMNYDALSRPSSYSQYGYSVTNTHDLANNLISQVQPDMSSSNDSIVLNWQYDERNRQRYMQDGAKRVTRYNWGAAGDVIDRFDATNANWSYSWYRHMPMSQSRPDGTSQTWERSTDLGKYVGISVGSAQDTDNKGDLYTGLGGSQIRKLYDLKSQLTRQYSESLSSRGQYFTITPQSVDGGAYSYYSVNNASLPAQDINYTYSGGFKTLVEDKASGLSTAYDYTDLGDCQYANIFETESGAIIHEMSQAIDALRRPMVTVDNQMNYGSEYDENGNVAHYRAWQSDDTNNPFADRYYTFDDSDRALIVEGDLTGSEIVQGSGFTIAYNQYSQRESEAYSTGSNTYSYYPMNQVKAIKSQSFREELPVYQLQDMDCLLRKRVVDARHVILAAVDLNQEGERYWSEYFQDQVMHHRARLSLKRKHVRSFCMPIHLGYRRWSLVWINVREDHRNMAPAITYYDPSGSPIPSGIKRMLRRVFPGATIKSNHLMVQKIPHDSAAWVVEAATSISNTNRVPERALDIRKAIKEHQITLHGKQKAAEWPRIIPQTEKDSSFEYDLSYWLIHSSDSESTVATTYFDNGAVHTQNTTGKSNMNTTFTVNACGEVTHQDTDDTSDNVQWHLDSTLAYINGSTQVITMSGYTHDKYGDKNIDNANRSFCMNGNILANIGVADKDDSKQSDTVYFLVSPDGIVRRQISMGPSSWFNFYSNESVTNWFYGPTNMYLGSHTTQGVDLSVGNYFQRTGNTGYQQHLSESLAQVHSATPNSVGYSKEQRYVQIGSSLLWGGTLFSSVFGEQQGLVTGSVCSHKVDPLNDEAHDYLGAIVQQKPYEKMPTYVVGQTDDAGTSQSIASIANLNTGDPASATAYQIANNLTLSSATSMQMQPGLLLNAPQYVANHLTSKTSTPQSELISQIMGQLMPVLSFKQKKHHWWSFIVEIVIGVIVSIVTGGIAGGPIVMAIVAAATDAALQGIAVATGLLDSFSLSEVIMSGLTAGVGGEASSGVNSLEEILDPEHLLKLAMSVSLKNLETQLVQIATGERKHLDFKELLLAVVEAPLNEVVNYETSKIPFMSDQELAAKVERAFVVANVDAVTADAIMGTKYDICAVLEQTSQVVVTEAVMDIANAIGDYFTQEANDVGKETGFNKPAGSSGKDKAKADLDSSGNNTEYRSGGIDQSSSTLFAKQVGMSASGGGSLGDLDNWLADTMFEHQQNSNFNKTWEGSIFPGSAKDVSNHMDYLMDLDTPGLTLPQWSSVSSMSSHIAVTAPEKHYSLFDDAKLFAKAAGQTLFGHKYSSDVVAWQTSNRRDYPKAYRNWTEIDRGIAESQKQMAAYYKPIAPYVDKALDGLMLVSLAVPGLDVIDAGVLGVRYLAGVYAAAKITERALPVAEDAGVVRASIRSRVLRNIAKSRLANKSSNFKVMSARSNQSLSGYNTDAWEMTQLKKGDVIYGGLPGRSNYYTDLESVLNSKGNPTSMVESIQSRPHPVLGPRSDIGEYVVTHDVRVPEGVVRANPHLGPGGANQYFISNYDSYLELQERYTLEEFYENRMQTNGLSP